MKTTENNAGQTDNSNTNVFARRRSSAHLHVAEKELDLRASTLIGLSKDQLQKFVNFDREYFQQLSKSPTFAFAVPKIGENFPNVQRLDSRHQKQTAHFVKNNINCNRTTVMKFQRAYTTSTQDNLIKNVNKQSYQRTKELPDFKASATCSLPPLLKPTDNNCLKKQHIFENDRSQSSPFVEQLPPIKLKPAASLKSSKLFTDDLKENRDQISENVCNSGGVNYKSKEILHNDTYRSSGNTSTGELKLHPQHNEFNELLEKNKSKKISTLSHSTSVRPIRALEEMGFHVSAAEPFDQAKDNLIESKSNFEIRKEYGRNLEKNWFRNFLLQNKLKEGNDDLFSSKFDLRLELFYSPEPIENEEHGTESDIDSKCNENIDITNEQTEVNEKKKHLLDISGLFSSTDVLTGKDNELDRDTQSEIEIILQDNELIQKKTKHKMRKKRKKKAKRCKEIFGTKSVNVEIPEVSDKELRALRLNIKKKKSAPILTGRRKFLQVANAVFIAVQFRKILLNIRNKQRKLRARKSRKRTKNVKCEKPLHSYDDYERLCTPQTLKQKFMQEIGTDLLCDVQKLYLKTDTDTTVENQGKAISKFWIEAEKACPEEVERFLVDEKRTLKNFKHLRHHSAPDLFRGEFLIETKEKMKNRKSEKSKALKRVKSSKKKCERSTKSSNLAPKCSCTSRKHILRDHSTCNSPNQNCSLKEIAEVPKVKHSVFHRSQVLQRRPSLNEMEISKSSEIDLHELLNDVDIPAKNIRIQIILRKMRKQKRLKDEAIGTNILLRPEPEISEDESITSVEPESECNSSDTDNCSTVQASPFVSSGVAWNQQKYRHRSFTADDVDQEVKRVTRFFLEMKNCSYIRFTGINQAIVERLNENILR